MGKESKMKPVSILLKQPVALYQMHLQLRHGDFLPATWDQ